MNFVIMTFNDEIRGKVDDFFNVLDGEAKKQGNRRRSATHKPDVRDRGGKGDMTHALAANNRASNKVSFFIYGRLAEAGAF